MPRRDAELKSLEALMEAFRKRGMGNVVFDPTIVRGFLYYTESSSRSSMPTLRTPAPFSAAAAMTIWFPLFGGDPIPAVGFGMGDVTLIDFLETHGLIPEGLTGAPTLSSARRPKATSLQRRHMLTPFARRA